MGLEVVKEKEYKMVMFGSIAFEEILCVRVCVKTQREGIRSFAAFVCSQTNKNQGASRKALWTTQPSIPYNTQYYSLICSLIIYLHSDHIYTRKRKIKNTCSESELYISMFTLVPMSYYEDVT